MRNFVCGNANAPRRVSHVLRIKVHGANVGAKIRRCVARGRPHNAHGASTHHTSHTRRSTPAGKETRAARSLSLLLMAMEEDNSRHTQLPACTTKGAFISTAMCILCVCGCVCLQKHKAKTQKRGSRVCGGTHKIKLKCTAGTHNGNNKKTAQTHDIALRLKQRQFTQYLLKTKNVPFVLCKPHHTK
ncbi:hypothetical protein TCDM_11959 [Trypanosoma cruzi Dm28c]|uniref:Uncharacterized protein n=1 Tax=Trypanosoma cruzi Dm28c TaxID=1416333 RepID=V5CZ51_TRYCR|nr:hypothetical protein TCDM_11959 [Trypanosoma cruzi Dm28c]